MYKWICVKCNKEITWNGKDKKPVTICEGTEYIPHNRIQMPLREMPKRN
jgi:hypothetical protein